MEFEGRILRILPARTGISKKSGNAWKALPFVFEYFETPDQRYSDKVLLEQFDTTAIDRMKEYDKVRIGFAPRLREYEGRLFNDIHMYKFEFIDDDAPQSAPEATQQGVATDNAPKTEKAPESAPVAPEDELPF